MELPVQLLRLQTQEGALACESHHATGATHIRLLRMRTLGTHASEFQAGYQEDARTGNPSRIQRASNAMKSCQPHVLVDIVNSIHGTSLLTKIQPCNREHCRKRESAQTEGDHTDVGMIVVRYSVKRPE